jgi:hypothetical protein
VPTKHIVQGLTSRVPLDFFLVAVGLLADFCAAFFALIVPSCEALCHCLLPAPRDQLVGLDADIGRGNLPSGGTRYIH